MLITVRDGSFAACGFELQLVVVFCKLSMLSLSPSQSLSASQPVSDTTDPMIPEPGREGLRRRGQEEKCEKRPMSEMTKGRRQRRALPGDSLRSLVSL
jgi:hypothetical protein